VRGPAEAALDVGCGGGVQSLLAARHVERVVGVDVNPRAIAFARFNARLNGVANVEFREGSLFEPVAGERFDRVVCNPPYVISPESELLFRDGGRDGDAFCEEVVRGAAEHLAPGGFATAVVNWVMDPAEPWSRPLERWVAGWACDAVLLRLETSEPLDYAAAWNRDPDGERYAAALDRWLAYYEAHGIRAIGMGAVVLRRRAAGVPWVRALDLPSRPRAQASDAILQAFAAQDRLEELGTSEQMLAARFRSADDLRLTQVAALRDGRFATDSTGLALDGPLPFEGRADTAALRLLQLSDGSRTLGEIAAAIRSGPDGPSGALVASLVEAARRLVTFGFLVPAEAGGRVDATANEAKPAPDAAPARGVGGGRRARARRRPPSVGAR
jgi:SAM-dependent methyltransferase